MKDDAKSTESFGLPVRVAPRHVELSALNQTLRERVLVANPVVLVGGPGMGKTEAVKSIIYSADSMAKYQLRLWFSAVNRVQLLSCYRQWLVFSEMLAFDYMRDWGDQRVMEEVNRRLNGLESFLVVLDGADEQVMDLVPQVRSAPGSALKHIIITSSRVEQWGPSAVVMEAPSLEDAVKIFESHSWRAKSQDVEQLVEEVGRLSLASSLLGAYARQNQIVSVKRLLERLRDKWKVLDEQKDLGIQFKTVWAALLTMMPDSEIAGQLLLGCSVMAAERITSRFLANLVLQLGKSEPDSALKLLTSLNLLSFNPQSKSYSLHRLVQEVMRLHHGRAKLESLLPMLVTALHDDFWGKEGGPLSVKRKRLGYIPHLDCLLSLGEILTDIDRARVLNMKAFALYSYFRQSFEAKQLLDQVIPTYEAQYGPTSSQVASLLNNLAVVVGQLGDLYRKKSLLKKALTIAEAIYGETSLLTAVTLTNLGNVSRSLEEWPDAKRFLHRALAILEAQHLQVAHVLSLLGHVHSDLREYSEADQVLGKAVGIYEQAPDRERDAQFANSLTKWAQVLASQRDYAKARSLLERSLQMKQSIYGRKHVQVAAALGHLSAVLCCLGEYEKAKELQQKALAVKEAVYNPNHVQVAKTLSILGDIYQSQKDFANAKEILERAVGILTASLGPDHLETSVALTRLGAVLFSLGEYHQAKNVLEKAIGIQETVSKPDSPYLVRAKHILALVLEMIDKSSTQSSLRDFRVVIPLGLIAVVYLLSYLLPSSSSSKDL